MFKSLEIHGWRQIERVDIQFHPRRTILTGANGTGKTTILNLISRHFGWSIPLVSTPVRDRKTGDCGTLLMSGKLSGQARQVIPSVASYYWRDYLRGWESGVSIHS